MQNVEKICQVFRAFIPDFMAYKVTTVAMIRQNMKLAMCLALKWTQVLSRCVWIFKFLQPFCNLLELAKHFSPLYWSVPTSITIRANVTDNS